MTERPRVVVIDDAPSVRILLRRTLPFYDIELVGEAEDARSGIKQVADLNPDVVLLDLHLPDRNGTEIIQDLKVVAPGVKVIMFTNDDQPEAMSAAISEGVDGYIVKLALIPDLAEEIERVASTNHPRMSSASDCD